MFPVSFYPPKFKRAYYSLSINLPFKNSPSMLGVRFRDFESDYVIFKEDIDYHERTRSSLSYLKNPLVALSRRNDLDFNAQQISRFAMICETRERPCIFNFLIFG